MPEPLASVAGCESKRFHYPPGSARGDYLRAAAGAALCVVPMSMLPLSSPVFALLALLVVGFGVFALQAAQRQLTGFALAEDNLRRYSRRGEEVFPWKTLVSLRLAYFSVRRDGRQGWMELKLTFDSGTVRVDSRLSGFETIVRAAAAAASLTREEKHRKRVRQKTLRHLEEMEAGAPAQAQAPG